MIALSTVVLGCTKSDVLESSKTFESPISFEPYTGKAPVTKATEATITTIQAEGVGFQVTGFIQNMTTSGETTTDKTDYTTPYLNKTVTYDGSSSWVYDGAAYWPESGKLCFVAYGRNAGANFSAVNDSYTEFTYTVPANVAGQKDLVISDLITDQSISDPTVDVTLNHVLSKVGFSVKTNNAASPTNGVTVTIKNVTLNGKFVNKGTVNLTASTAAITPSTNTADITECYSLFDSSYKKDDEPTTALPCFNTGNSTTAKEIYASHTFTNDTDDTKLNLEPATSPNENDRFMMIMPGTVGNLADDVPPYIEVVYQLTDAEEQVAKVPLVQSTGTMKTNWNFLPGTSYEFVFTVSTTAIGFTVEVGAWTDYEGSDTTYTLTPEA